MPKRTAQDTLAALKELAIEVEFIGGNKNGYYQLNSWGAVNEAWVKSNVNQIKRVLGYP